MDAYEAAEETALDGRFVDEVKGFAHPGGSEEQDGLHAGRTERVDVVEEPATGQLGPEDVDGDPDLVVEVLEAVATREEG